MNDPESKQFLDKFAKSSTGRRMITYLEKVEIHYADIRNLEQIEPGIRVEALKLLRECLLDKLIVLSGKVVPPNGDEWS